MSYSPLFQDGSISSNVFSVKDFLDDTKKITFNATNVGSGFSRAIVMPDFNVDLADIYTHASRHLPGGLDALTTAAAVDISTANAEGVAAAFARSDHTHRGVLSVAANAGPARYGAISLVDGTAITIVDDGFGNFTISTGAGGTVTSVALTVPSFLSVVGSPITTAGTFVVSLATQTANTVFSGPAAGGPLAPTFRSLVVADFPTGVPTTQTPDLANAEGVSAQIARADHVHNIPADVPVSQTPDQANAEGVANSFARSDHNHLIATAVASSISTNANAQGVATSFARSDHTHRLTNAAALLDHVPRFDGTNWVPVYPENLLSMSRSMFIREEWISGAVTGTYDWLTTLAGGSSTTAISSTLVSGNHIGILAITGGNASGRYANISMFSTVALGGGEMVITCLFQLTTVTNANYRIGLGDLTTNADFNNGVYLEYNSATSANWLIKTANGGTRTSTTTGTAATASAWHTIEITINAGATSVSYVLDGVSLGTIATNIPTVVIGPVIVAHSLSTSVSTLHCDYYSLAQRFTTAR